MRHRRLVAGGAEMPLAVAGRLVPEDLCLMRRGPGGYRLVAAVLCFPTRWRLAEKLGKPMGSIHAPVPGYAARIGAASDRVLESLTVERPVWRQNWSLLDSPALYQPRRVPARAAAPSEDLGQRLWLRSERQTLRRLPDTGDVLFTLRIRQCSLAALVQVEGAAARLLGHLRSLPPELLRYKGLDRVAPRLDAWLASRTP